MIPIAIDFQAEFAASDNRLTASVDAFERAGNAALEQLVVDTSRTLAGT
jgi:hypothetical protein